MKPPPLADAGVEAGVQLVETLGTLARVGGQEAAGADEFLVAGEGRRAALSLAARELDHHRLPASDLELLHAVLAEQFPQPPGRRRRCGLPAHRPVGAVHAQGGGSQRRHRPAQAPQLAFRASRGRRRNRPHDLRAGQHPGLVGVDCVVRDHHQSDRHLAARPGVQAQSASQPEARAGRHPDHSGRRGGDGAQSVVARAPVGCDHRRAIGRGHQAPVRQRLAHNHVGHR